MPRARGRDLAEIFGFAPDDLSEGARRCWNEQLCPFCNTSCIKFNHDKTVCYGACSVVNPGGLSKVEVIICPRRLYADNYRVIKEVSDDAFPRVPFYLYEEYKKLVQNEERPQNCVVALGQGSGREVQVGSSGSQLSMDWILARLNEGILKEFCGIEVQSIDITGNYRSNWQAYFNLPTNFIENIPDSSHGLNWANVHKRLIPQIIRKGVAISISRKCTKGLYFILPESVYKKFEDVVGEVGKIDEPSRGILSVFTYALGPEKPSGEIRDLNRVRIERMELEEFALKFISGGGNLPQEQEIESRIQSAF